MPPKKGGGGGKDAKAREKAVEDKTFGMKNKKGAKGQKIVAQVKQSMDATANRGSRGPSKKEMKEMQKAQEAEMLALFNAVPKKNDDKPQTQAELDPDAGPTFTDITQEIEYQRANVVAKTKITEEVFQAWRKKKMATRLAAEEAERRERHHKGLLTGREIFMETKVSITDDDTAADDMDMLREVDEELEIAKMNALAQEEQKRAREEAGMGEPDATEQVNKGGASTSSGIGGGQKFVTSTGVQLSAEDAAILDDDDDVDLDELEASIRASKLQN